MKKPYTLVVKNMDGWWSAVCPELLVSGFGPSKEEAILSVARSMESKLKAQALSLAKDLNNVELMAQLQAA